MHYYSFSTYLKERFHAKVWRLSLDAGFSCPNKDEKGEGGCIFCNELGFSRYAGENKPLKDQIEESIGRARGKGAEKFIAYFQNATNTYAEPARLKEAYDIIRNYPDIVSISISTRPDCINDEKLDLIRDYTRNYEVWVEYGIQTVHNGSLEKIGRGHTFDVSEEAIIKTAGKGIKVGAHVILGLPGETREDMVKTARELSRLPVSGVKLHVLHVLKGTPMEDMYDRGEIELLECDEYIDIVCDFLENLRQDCVILRLVSDAKKEFLIAPEWINNKLAVIAEIEKEFNSRGTRQGSSSTT
jgi:radical SAM protein (TIGR01212 family)